MTELADTQFRYLENQDSSTQCVLPLSRDVFVKYILIKIVYFHLKYYGLLLYSKIASSLITSIKIMHMYVSFDNEGMI